MTDFIDQLVAKIDLELARATAEIEQLTLGRQALTNDAKPATTTTTKRPAAGRRAQPTRTPATVVAADTLLATLGASTGLSSAELANATGPALPQIRELLKTLERDGQVRRDGHARGLRWHAVTDEERVARRAAEIEERLRQPKRERPHLARAHARRS